MKADVKQFGSYHKKMRRILVWLEDQTGVEFTITSPHRIGDTGVHGQLPLRGVDLRMRSKSVGEAIVKFINKHWLYDHVRPHKKCAIIHGEGSKLHIHIQVHENTR